MRRLITLAVFAAFCSLAPAQDADVKRIQSRYDAALPDEKSLAFYSLDWAMSLSEAKERAKKESRPILLVLNTNITAGNNFFSGHT